MYVEKPQEKLDTTRDHQHYLTSLTAVERALFTPLKYVYCSGPQFLPDNLFMPRILPP